MRKGQAATEFLMTYGWAILVVLVAIGMLSYFRVLSPNRFIDRCDCYYEGMTTTGIVIEDGITYMECFESESYLNEEMTRIETQSTYTIFYCSENNTLIPVR